MNCAVVGLRRYRHRRCDAPMAILPGVAWRGDPEEQHGDGRQHPVQELRARIRVGRTWTLTTTRATSASSSSRCGPRGAAMGQSRNEARIESMRNAQKRSQKPTYSSSGLSTQIACKVAGRVGTILAQVRAPQLMRSRAQGRGGLISRAGASTFVKDKEDSIVYAILDDAARRARRYLDGLQARSVAPDASAAAALRELDGPLPEARGDAAEDSRAARPDGLARDASAIAGPRFFGFVIGGCLPRRSRPTGSRARGTRTRASTATTPGTSRILRASRCAGCSSCLSCPPAAAAHS